MRIAIVLVGLLFFTAPVSASILTPTTFYMHYSTSAVTVPGGSTNHYMDQTQPTGSPNVRGPYSVNAGATTSLPDFTSTPIAGGLSLDRLDTLTLLMSANHNLTACITVAATLTRLDAAGVASPLATGSKDTALLQGTGGGLTGNTAVAIPLFVDPDPRIAAGGAVKVSVNVTNSCASNVSVRVVVDNLSINGAFSSADFATPDVTLFGQPNAFGDYNNPWIATGSLTLGLARSPVTNWATDNGLSIYLGTVASDGSIFIGNYFYNGNAFYSSSCSTAITCFNPWSKECPVGGSKDNFANIRFTYGAPPNQFNPSTLTSPTQCLTNSPPPYPGGADIADVQVIDDGGEKLMYISSKASLFPEEPPPAPPGIPEPYPATGRLDKSSGTWTLTSPRFRTDLSGDPAGSQVCPSPFGNPQCGALSEFKQLTSSKHIIIAQYGTGLAAMNQSGNLVAYLALPPVGDGCPSGSGVTLSAKTVSGDPTSAVPHERFVISYDVLDTATNAARSGAFQLFEYDTSGSSPVIRPVTAPMFAATPTYGSARCAAGGTNNAAYNNQGDLLVSRNFSGMGIADVFVAGSTNLAACAIATVGSNYGASCTPDQEFTGMPNQVYRVVEDPATGAAFYAGLSAKIGVLTHTTGSHTFTQKSTVVDLRKSNLDAIDPLAPGITRPLVDSARRILWLPVSSLQSPPTTTPPRLAVPTWMYAVDIDRLLALP